MDPKKQNLSITTKFFGFNFSLSTLLYVSTGVDKQISYSILSYRFVSSVCMHVAVVHIQLERVTVVLMNGGSVVWRCLFQLVLLPLPTTMVYCPSD